MGTRNNQALHGSVLTLCTVSARDRESERVRENLQRIQSRRSTETYLPSLPPSASHGSASLHHSCHQPPQQTTQAVSIRNQVSRCVKTNKCSFLSGSNALLTFFFLLLHSRTNTNMKTSHGESICGGRQASFLLRSQAAAQ